MTYIRPTLNRLAPAASAIRGEDGPYDHASCWYEKTAIGLDGVFARPCYGIHTSSTSAYEVDE
jgi:hypothetical protein